VIPCSTRLSAAPTHVRLRRGEGGVSEACVLKCEKSATLHQDDVRRQPLGGALPAEKVLEVERAVLRAIGVPALLSSFLRGGFPKDCRTLPRRSTARDRSRSARTDRTAFYVAGRVRDGLRHGQIARAGARLVLRRARGGRGGHSDAGAQNANLMPAASKEIHPRPLTETSQRLNFKVVPGSIHTGPFLREGTILDPRLWPGPTHGPRECRAAERCSLIRLLP